MDAIARQQEAAWANEYSAQRQKNYVDLAQSSLSGGLAALTSLAGLYGATPRAEKPFPRAEYQRKHIWERRVNRIKEKHMERRKAKVLEALWMIGWTWGGLIAAAVTIGLLGLLSRMVLG
jgi:hypothetical protein